MNEPQTMSLKTEYGVGEWSWCIHPEEDMVRIFNEDGVLKHARCMRCKLEWMGTG